MLLIQQAEEMKLSHRSSSLPSSVTNQQPY